jgi:hypothetical protein
LNTKLQFVQTIVQAPGSNVEARSVLEQYLAATEKLRMERKPEWQVHLDWAIKNTGSPDCPELYVASDVDCLWKGNRACLMSRAINAAKADRLKDAFEKALVAQCQSPGAGLSILNAGTVAVVNYLKAREVKP